MVASRYSISDLGKGVMVITLKDELNKEDNRAEEGIVRGIRRIPCRLGNGGDSTGGKYKYCSR